MTRLRAARASGCRGDGDRIQAYLGDAETSEIHPALTDGQREYDAEILVENVAFGLADLAALQEAPDPEDAIAAAVGGNSLGANLFAADLMKAVLDQETNLEDANLQRARIVGERK